MSRGECPLSFQVEEHRDYGAIKVKGILQSAYDLQAVSLNVKGTLSTDKDLHIKQDVKLKGIIVVKDIYAATVKVHGRIQAHDILADQIKIVSSRMCSVHKISGTRIELCNGFDSKENEKVMNGLLKILNIPLLYSEDEPTALFKVSEICGDNIDLSNITADLVAGSSIILKNHCHIGRVICTGDLVMDETCFVQHTSKG